MLSLGALLVAVALPQGTLAYPSSWEQPTTSPKTLLPLLPHELQDPFQPHGNFSHSYSNNFSPGQPLKRLPPRTPAEKMYAQKDLIHWTRAETSLLNWAKQMEYSGRTFFDGWDFFHEADPSHGLVSYQDSPVAFGTGLAFWTDSGIPGIQVEHWSQKKSGQPRNSVRISTRSLFAGGLFIIDMQLMPWGYGVWPAFWTLGYGAKWPTVGEIDIIEGIQAMTNNQMTIHTLPGCRINQAAGLYTGTVTNPVCDHESGGTGCGIVSSSASSFGEPFNAAGGGVFAMLWDGDGIRMWDWNRANIPVDIQQQQPTPKTWGTPTAAFDASTCNPYEFFTAQTLILNIDLCGDWAGNLFNQFSYCHGTCADHIADPANLVNTVMLVNYIRVYQLSGIPAVVGQAQDNSNQTGAGGPVDGQRSSGARTGFLTLGTLLGLVPLQMIVWGAWSVWNIG